MEQTNIVNNLNQPANNQSINSTTPKTKNIYKYLFFITLILLFMVVGSYITTNKKTSQTINNINKNDKLNPTELIEKESITKKDNTEVSNTNITKTISRENWLIKSISEKIDQKLTEDPKIISYQENPDIDVYTIEFSALNFFDKASQHASYSHECDSALKNYIKRDENYYNNIISKFNSNDKGYIYVFKYKKENQGRDSWLITLIPNKIGYSSFEDFNNDFIQCTAGADSPKAISKNYLFFESACGTGFNDGSSLPIGCNVVKAYTEPFLKLN